MLSLVASLERSSTDTSEEAVAALVRLAADDWDLAVAAGVLPALVGLLQHSSAEVAKQASWALSNARKDQIVAAGALLPLLGLLQHSSARVVEQAVRTLEILSVRSYTIQNKIVALGALPLLVRLLQHTSAEVIEQAASLLWILTSNTSYSDAYSNQEACGYWSLATAGGPAAAFIRRCG